MIERSRHVERDRAPLQSGHAVEVVTIAAPTTTPDVEAQRRHPAVGEELGETDAVRERIALVVRAVHEDDARRTTGARREAQQPRQTPPVAGDDLDLDLAFGVDRTHGPSTSANQSTISGSRSG